MGYGDTVRTDREATQTFAVRNILTTYCGQRLTADLIEKLVDEIEQEMQSSPTAWAFKEKKELPSVACDEEHPNNRLLFKRMCAKFGVELGVDTIAQALHKVATKNESNAP